MTNEERYKEALEKILECARKSGKNSHHMSIVGMITGSIIDACLDALNPPPLFEEVEVVRWCCPECGASYEKEHLWGLVCCQNIKIKLTGTYQRPIPQKVKRREEIIACLVGTKVVSGSLLPKSLLGVKLFAEWEETPQVK